MGKIALKKLYEQKKKQLILKYIRYLWYKSDFFKSIKKNLNSELKYDIFVEFRIHGVNINYFH